MTLVVKIIQRWYAWAKTYFGLQKKVWIIALFIFLFTVLIGGMVGIISYRFVWVNPKFCYACHIHDYANKAWETSVHAVATTCHDCHQEDLKYYLRVSYAMLVDRPQFPDDLYHAPQIPSGVCQTCHISTPKRAEALQSTIPREDIARFVKVDKIKLHALHLKQDNPLVPSQKIDCHNCHGSDPNRAHRFRASINNCLQCHRELKHAPSVRSTKNIPCSKCHFIDFLQVHPAKAP